VRRSARTFDRRTAEAGLTLLELAVVIFLIGLTVTLAAPYFSGFRNSQIKNEVRRLAGRIAFVYDTAASHKLVMRMTFDLDGNRYFVSQLDPYAVMPIFAPASQGGTAPVMLPQGVRLRDVTVENQGTISRGTVSCQFYPEGYVDATIIHLDDEWGDLFTLMVDPLTGRVAIARGEYDLASRRRAGQ